MPLLNLCWLDDEFGGEASGLSLRLAFLFKNGEWFGEESVLSPISFLEDDTSLDVTCGESASSLSFPLKDGESICKKLGASVRLIFSLDDDADSGVNNNSTLPVGDSLLLKDVKPAIGEPTLVAGLSFLLEDGELDGKTGGMLLDVVLLLAVSDAVGTKSVLSLAQSSLFKAGDAEKRDGPTLLAGVRFFRNDDDSETGSPKLLEVLGFFSMDGEAVGEANGLTVQPILLLRRCDACVKLSSQLSLVLSLEWWIIEAGADWESSWFLRVLSSP